MRRRDGAPLYTHLSWTDRRSAHRGLTHLAVAFWILPALRKVPFIAADTVPGLVVGCSDKRAFSSEHNRSVIFTTASQNSNIVIFPSSRRILMEIALRLYKDSMMYTYFTQSLHGLS